MFAHFKERDQQIQDEIARYAAKIQQEAKVTDSKLDDIEVWIEDEVTTLFIFSCLSSPILIQLGITNLFTKNKYFHYWLYTVDKHKR